MCNSILYVCTVHTFVPAKCLVDRHRWDDEVNGAILHKQSMQYNVVCIFFILLISIYYYVFAIIWHASLCRGGGRLSVGYRLQLKRKESWLKFMRASARPYTFYSLLSFILVSVIFFSCFYYSFITQKRRSKKEIVEDGFSETKIQQ